MKEFKLIRKCIKRKYSESNGKGSYFRTTDSNLLGVTGVPRAVST